jgi:hypothetical protein
VTWWPCPNGSDCGRGRRAGATDGWPLETSPSADVDRSMALALKRRLTAEAARAGTRQLACVRREASGKPGPAA